MKAQFQKNVKKSFKSVKEDMDAFKGATEKWLLHLIQKQRELEARVEELEAKQRVAAYQ